MFSYESILYFVLKLIAIVILIKVFNYVTLGVCKSNACLVGKTVLITGANSGIGYQTALFMATRGGRIIIADKNDASETIKEIVDKTHNKNLVYKYLDLASLASVREFARQINEEEDRLDILINNAGIAASNTYTEDGLQTVMQTNHFGPFLLTHLLIGLLQKSAPSRIVFVSSILAYTCKVSRNNLNESRWRGWGVYDRSKLMNILTAYILGEKLQGTGITANSVYPGIVNTSIYKSAGGVNTGTFWKGLIYKVLLPIFGKTAWQGAQTVAECALSRDLENVTSKFFVDCKSFPLPWKLSDKEGCTRLWKKSEELVHLQESEKLF